MSEKNYRNELRDDTECRGERKRFHSSKCKEGLALENLVHTLFSLDTLHSRPTAPAMKLWIVLLVCLCCVDTSAAERHALVIGNSHYSADGLLVTPLNNCVPDARLIDTTLESLGFKVTKVEDATKSVMDESLLTWEQNLPKDCDALVYFAGHGIEHNGKNYLLGTNSKLKAQSRIGEEALEALEAETVAPGHAPRRCQIQFSLSRLLTRGSASGVGHARSEETWPSRCEGGR